MSTKVTKFRTTAVFRRLVAERGLQHCRLPGVETSAAHRLWMGRMLPRPAVIDKIARALGDGGEAVAAAWLEDKLDQMPFCRKRIAISLPARRP